jgi:hypothetical protein
MQSQGQSQREELATFEAVAKRWHDNRKSALNPAHAERVRSRLERDVFPAIGHKPSLDPRYAVACPGNGVVERLVIEAKVRRIIVVDRREPLGRYPKSQAGGVPG